MQNYRLHPYLGTPRKDRGDWKGLPMAPDWRRVYGIENRESVFSDCQLCWCTFEENDRPQKREPYSLVWVNAKKISNFVQNISLLSFTLIIEWVDLSEWSEEAENILNKKGADEAKDETIKNEVC